MIHNRIIRHPEAIKLTGLSRTTLWRLEKEDSFPNRVKLGPHSVGWLLTDVMNWLEKRPYAKRSENGA